MPICDFEPAGSAVKASKPNDTQNTLNIDGASKASERHGVAKASGCNGVTEASDCGGVAEASDLNGGERASFLRVCLRKTQRF
ncbi:hypothetical protein Pmar_PMAR007800, partial [Perkinsus marinus ATCC 50983]